MNVNEEYTHTHKVLSNFWVSGSWLLIVIMSLINHDEHIILINPLSLIHKQQQQIAQQQDETKISEPDMITLKKLF